MERLRVDCADGVSRTFNPYVKTYAERLSEQTRQLGELGRRGMELTDPERPEMGFKMSLTDGLPVPVEHDIVE